MEFKYSIIYSLILAIFTIGIILVSLLINGKNKKAIVVPINNIFAKIIHQNKFKFILLKIISIINYSAFTLIIILLLILALRPQKTLELDADLPSIDIHILLDISRSMEEIDVSPTRLDVAKDVVKELIANTTVDRIALTGFLFSTNTLSPLTRDYAFLTSLVDGMNYKLVSFRVAREEGLSGTHIGDAIVSTTLKFSDKELDRTRIIILITDGENDGGLSVDEATKFAKNKNVKVYPIFISGAITGRGQETIDTISKISGTRGYTAKSKKDLSNIIKDTTNCQNR
jgi:hypothetical protein